MKRCYGLVLLGIALVGCGAENKKPIESPREEAVVKETEPERKEKELKVIVDSDMTRSEALGENEFPKDVLAQMEVVKVRYLGFDGHEHVGQIVVHREVAEEVIEIFAEIRKAEFPISQVVPIVAYGWKDQDSIDDQNSSGFNYRKTEGPGISGTILSRHSFGKAIDLNPFQNPFVAANGDSPRPYMPGEKGVLTADSAPVKIFKKYGWKWGGDWRGAKDYQHFEHP